MDIIEKKIEQLGGVEITKVFAPKKDSNFSIENFQTENKILLPEKYIFFSNKYGFGQFNEDIIFDSISKIPSSYDDGTCPISFIYGWGKGTESLQKVRKTFLEQLPANYFVFAESNPGDQLLINTLDNKVYYWAHEEPEKRCIFLVSNNFEDFINSLKINLNKNDDDDLEEESFSDDF